jgi:hypothetical protein
MRTMTITIERIPKTLRFQGQSIDVEMLGIRLPFARKADSLQEMCACGDTRVYITETILMTPAEFDEFAGNLSKPHDWLKGKGGHIADGVLCVEVHAPGRPYLYVDPSGYDSARHVARLG